MGIGNEVSEWVSVLKYRHTKLLRARLSCRSIPVYATIPQDRLAIVNRDLCVLLPYNELKKKGAKCVKA